tara:strand:- start:15910 stop:16881 length:972 start_codon:yes stop_codon:yes gene_type:complete
MRRKVALITTLSNDPNGVCEDQQIAAAGALTLDGALVGSNIGRLPTARRLTIEGTGDNSLITFTIVGTDGERRPLTELVFGGNAAPVSTSELFLTVTSITTSGAVTGNVEVGWVAADDPNLVPDVDAICVDQTTTAATTLSLDGASVTTGTATTAGWAQRLSMESSADLSSVDVVIVGWDADGEPRTETVALPNATTSYSVQYWTEIDSITTDGAVGTNVEIGFTASDGAVSATLVPEEQGYHHEISIQLTVAGTMTITSEYTTERMPAFGNVEPTWEDITGLAGVSASVSVSFLRPHGGLRTRISAYTSGTCETETLQDLAA